MYADFLIFFLRKLIHWKRKGNSNIDTNRVKLHVGRVDEMVPYYFIVSKTTVNTDPKQPFIITSPVQY